MNNWAANLGAIGIVSFAMSALVGLIWLLISKYIRKLAPAAQSRIILLLLIFPMMVASISLFAYWEHPSSKEHFWSFISGESKESMEHGTKGEHGSEGEHRKGHGKEAGSGLPSSFSILFVVMGGLVLARLAWMLFRALKTIHTSINTSASLREAASGDTNNMYVIPNGEPEAFVLGILKPQLFVSQGLLKMSIETVDAVIAHERGHIKRRDPLRCIVTLLATTFHLPYIAKSLQERMLQTQELAADALAADLTGDPTSIAEALVSCTRSNIRGAHLAFGGGDLEERVRTLLDENRSLDQPKFWLVGLIALIVTYACVLYAAPAHHLFERLSNFS